MYEYTAKTTIVFTNSSQQKTQSWHLNIFAFALSFHNMMSTTKPKCPLDFWIITIHQQPWQVLHGVLDLLGDEVELVPPVISKASVESENSNCCCTERPQVVQLVKTWKGEILSEIMPLFLKIRIEIETRPVWKLSIPLVAIETSPPMISTAIPTLGKFNISKVQRYLKQLLSNLNLTSLATVNTFWSLADHLTDHMLIADIRPGIKMSQKVTKSPPQKTYMLLQWRWVSLPSACSNQLVHCWSRPSRPWRTRWTG